MSNLLDLFSTTKDNNELVVSNTQSAPKAKP